MASAKEGKTRQRSPQLQADIRRYQHSLARKTIVGTFANGSCVVEFHPDLRVTVQFHEDYANARKKKNWKMSGTYESKKPGGKVVLKIDREELERITTGPKKETGVKVSTAGKTLVATRLDERGKEINIPSLGRLRRQFNVQRPEVVAPPPNPSPEPAAATPAVVEQEGEEDAVSAVAPAEEVPRSAAVDASSSGFLLTWGGARFGALGHKAFSPKELVCPFPHPVDGLGAVVVAVACGEVATAAITQDGALFTFGAGRGGRLGHGNEKDCERPTRVTALCKEQVTSVAVGENHMVCGTALGRVYSWGAGRHGALGTGEETNQRTPVCVTTLPEQRVTGVSAGNLNSACVFASGDAFTWGNNSYGKLGHGDTTSRRVPTLLKCLAGRVRTLHLGSCYSGACTLDGELYMWGDGAFGNLGLGARESHFTPQHVTLPAEEKAVQVHCAVGSLRSENPRSAGGKEGHHTLVVTAAGNLYTFGTSHKGILANCRKKMLVVPERDELQPYRVGGPLRDTPDGEASNYLTHSRVVHGLASCIHSACVTAEGELYSWGCGSTGRMGVQKYMTGLHGGRSRMKCYISEPTAVVGLAGPERRYRVIAAATSKRHMAAVAVPLGKPRKKEEKKS